MTTKAKLLSALSASIDQAGKIPATSGGTGLSAPGTSGNVLTSNGTIWQSSPPPVSTGKAIAMAMIFGG